MPSATKIKYGWQYWVGITITIFVIIFFSQGYFQKFLDTSLQKPWVEFKSIEGRFSVSFSQEPQQKMETIRSDYGDLNLYYHSATDSSDISYNVIYSDIPLAVFQNKTVEQFLDDSASGEALSLGATIIYRRVITFDDNQGLEFKLDIAGSHVYQARHYLVDGRSYQLIVVAPRDKIAYKSVEDFLNSFKLLS